MVLLWSWTSGMTAKSVNRPTHEWTIDLLGRKNCRKTISEIILNCPSVTRSHPEVGMLYLLPLFFSISFLCVPSFSEGLVLFLHNRTAPPRGCFVVPKSHRQRDRVELRWSRGEWMTGDCVLWFTQFSSSLYLLSSIIINNFHPPKCSGLDEQLHSPPG